MNKTKESIKTIANKIASSESMLEKEKLIDELLLATDNYAKEYADWKIKECVGEEEERGELFYEENGISRDDGRAFFTAGRNSLRRDILSNKDKK